MIEGGLPSLRIELDRLEASPEQARLQRSLEHYVEAALWCGWFGTAGRARRLHACDPERWRAQASSVRDWMAERWPVIRRLVKINVRHNKKRYEIHVRLRNVQAVELPHEVVRGHLKRAARMDRAGAVRAERGDNGRNTPVVRGSGHESLYKAIASIDGYDRVFHMKHSVQDGMLCESDQLRRKIERARPLRIVFPTTNRFGRAAWKGDLDVLGVMGIPVGFNNQNGGEDHAAGPKGPKVRQHARHLDGWWLVPEAVDVGWLVPGTRARLVPGAVAEAMRLEAQIDVHGGHDRTLLHLVALFGRLAPDCTFRLHDTGRTESVLLFPEHPTLEHRLGRRVYRMLPGLDRRALSRYVKSMRLSESFMPRGEPKKILDKLAARDARGVDEGAANLSSKRGAASARPAREFSRHERRDPEHGSFDAAGF